MNKIKSFLLPFLIALLSPKLVAKETRQITYENAIRIALGESYTVKYHQEDMNAVHYSYLYTRSDFKPMLNVNLFTPSWNEGLEGISQVDGLPVYNSIGSMQAGGNLNFTYVLPTGGNFAFSSNMYWENYRITLANKNYEKLEHDQVYSRFALSFNQPIFTTNRLKENMKVAQLNYQKSTYYFTRVQMNIIYNVAVSFYEVYELAYELKINQDRLANSQEAFRITKLKQETGNLPEGELLIAEITVAQNEARVMESEGKLEAAKDEFKLLIGLDLSEEIELIAEMEFETFFIDMEQAINEALVNRIEIQENSIDIELHEIEVKKAKRERELKGNISAYYDFTGLSTRDGGSLGQLISSSFSNMSDRPSNRGVALTLSYPIADWGRSKNQVKRTQSRLKQCKLDMDNTCRSIEREVREIVRSVFEAEKRYRINRRNQEVAIESYRISQLRFENGDMTSQELSIEQERLSQVQLSYIESYITYRLSVANLNRKTMYDFKHKRSYLFDRQD